MQTKLSSWPKPPITESTEPPKIPKEYEIYGLNYIVEEDRPVLVTRRVNGLLCLKNFKKSIKQALDDSLKIFHESVKNLAKRGYASISVAKLKEHHEKINNSLCDYRRNEAEITLSVLKNEKIDFKNEIIKELERKVNLEMIEKLSLKAQTIQKYL